MKLSTFTFPASNLTVNRMGYGAMQLAGPHVFGPPKDEAAAIAVLREAIELGVNHIDTSDFYGPHFTNQVIKKALYPYPKNLTIVTKVGCFRGAEGSWDAAYSKADLTKAIDDNLRSLSLEAIDIVNLRVGAPVEEPGASISERFSVMVDLQRQGKIRHLGLSTVNQAQVEEALAIAPIACVQNLYNVANRADDGLIDWLAAMGIAYVPYFPLGGFSPLQSSTLDKVAKDAGHSPMQVALAWLLQRSSNILLIPGTSSVKHLRENLAARDIQLTPAQVADLNSIATAK